MWDGGHVVDACQGQLLFAPTAVVGVLFVVGVPGVPPLVLDYGWWFGRDATDAAHMKLITLTGSM